MAIVKAVLDSVGGTFADQWKELITADSFDEHTVVSPGILKTGSHGRGSNTMGTDGVITSGSKIFVPENTAAFIFSQSGIEDVITEPGGYEYQNGQDSVFNGDGLGKSLLKQMKDRVGYGGIPSDQKRIAFVNLREIRSILFGTKGPQVYNDLFYGTDLEVRAYGSFTVKVIDPVTFIRNFVPANVGYCSFDDKATRAQVLAEFLQSFSVALNGLSTEYRISQLPSHANDISQKISQDDFNAGTWPSRFGFQVVKVAIESIEFTDESRELVRQYSSNKMSAKAYDDVSQKTSNVAAQQKIAQGVQDNGLGEGGGMLFGMNMAQAMSPATAEVKPAMTLDEQIEAVKKLKSLLDAGILTQDEFDTKKKETMGL